MKKSSVMGALIHLLVLGLFNAMFFVLGGSDHPASVWIAYGFIHAAYLMMVLTPFITQKGRDRATYAASMYTISSVYFVVELILGVILILVAPEGYKFSLFSQLALAVIYVIILFGNMMVDEHTAQAVERHEAELVYVKESCTMLKGILEGINDRQLYRKVERAYDVIQSSPVKSGPNVYEIEGDVMSQISRLENAVRKGDAAAIEAAADKIVSLANERNRLLRLTNG